MLTPTMFDEQGAALAAANGLSVDLARKYMALIGDAPEIDGGGRLIVRDENGIELARLKAPLELSSPA